MSHPVLLDQERLGSRHSQSVEVQLLLQMEERRAGAASRGCHYLQTAANSSPRAALSPGEYFGWANGSLTWDLMKL